MGFVNIIHGSDPSNGNLLFWMPYKFGRLPILRNFLKLLERMVLSHVQSCIFFYMLAPFSGSLLLHLNLNEENKLR